LNATKVTLDKKNICEMLNVKAYASGHTFQYSENLSGQKP